MTTSSNNSGGNGPIAPVIGRTLLRAIAGALLVETIVLIYMAWFNKRKKLQ